MKFPESGAEGQTVTFQPKKGGANMTYLCRSWIPDNPFWNQELGNYQQKQKDACETK
jgi:hypothetical protein